MEILTPKNTEEKKPVVRVYEIDGVKYIVTATSRNGAKEDLKTKIRRLILTDITKKSI